MTNSSTVGYSGRTIFADSQTSSEPPPTIVNSTVKRMREYLTGSEVEALMAAARKSSRCGHRDATMILIAYRHGLRASEVCDLRWHRSGLPRAGIPFAIHPHMLRHACGYALANKGHD